MRGCCWGFLFSFFGLFACLLLLFFWGVLVVLVGCCWFWEVIVVFRGRDGYLL